MDNVLVSIVIPVYNVEMYIEECLESVLNQTYGNLEVLCVEDASTDGSLAVLKRLAVKDARIKVVENEKNSGAAYSRNVGLSLARGKYTYFLDADDYIETNAIEELCSCAEECDTECIFFDSKIVNECDGLGVPGVQFGLEEFDKKIYDGPTLFKILRDHNVYSNSIWRRFWKTEYLIKNELTFPNGLLAEDMLFGVKSVWLGKRMMIWNKCYHLYRRREGTFSTRDNSLKMISIFKTYCALVEMWMKCQFSVAVDEAINQYLKMILNTAKRLYIRYKEDVSVSDFETEKEKHLFEVLMLQEFENSLNNMDKAIVDRIKRFDKVIVYGAARYAVEVVERLKRQGIRVDSLAITKMHENARGIGDIPVKEIQELVCVKDEAIVVFGVHVKYREEIKCTLQEYGFKNYIEID